MKIELDIDAQKIAFEDEKTTIKKCCCKYRHKWKSERQERVLDYSGRVEV